MVLLLLQGSHSYILLTANLDDIHAIAKQIADSPIAGQINRIVRRASSVFNQQVRASRNYGNQHHYPRANTQDSASSEHIQDNRIERRRQADQGQHGNHQYRRSEPDKTNESSQRRSQSDYRTTYSAPHNQQIKMAKNFAATSDYTHKRLVNDVPDGNNANENSQNKKEPFTDSGIGKDTDTRNDKDTKYVQSQDRQASEQEGKENNEADEEGKKKQSEEEPRHDTSIRSHTDEVVALGKNASYYLDSMKNIMENV